MQTCVWLPWNIHVYLPVVHGESDALHYRDAPLTTDEPSAGNDGRGGVPRAVWALCRHNDRFLTNQEDDSGDHREADASDAGTPPRDDSIYDAAIPTWAETDRVWRRMLAKAKPNNIAPSRIGAVAEEAPIRLVTPAAVLVSNVAEAAEATAAGRTGASSVGSCRRFVSVSPRAWMSATDAGSDVMASTNDGTTTPDKLVLARRQELPSRTALSLVKEEFATQPYHVDVKGTAIAELQYRLHLDVLQQQQQQDEHNDNNSPSSERQSGNKVVEAAERTGSSSSSRIERLLALEESASYQRRTKPAPKRGGSSRAGRGSAMYHVGEFDVSLRSWRCAILGEPAIPKTLFAVMLHLLGSRDFATLFETFEATPICDMIAAATASSGERETKSIERQRQPGGGTINAFSCAVVEDGLVQFVRANRGVLVAFAAMTEMDPVLARQSLWLLAECTRRRTLVSAALAPTAGAGLRLGLTHSSSSGAAAHGGATKVRRLSLLLQRFAHRWNGVQHALEYHDFNPVMRVEPPSREPSEPSAAKGSRAGIEAVRRFGCLSCTGLAERVVVACLVTVLARPEGTCVSPVGNTKPGARESFTTEEGPSDIGGFHVLRTAPAASSGGASSPPLLCVVLARAVEFLNEDDLTRNVLYPAPVSSSRSTEEGYLPAMSTRRRGASITAQDGSANDGVNPSARRLKPKAAPHLRRLFQSQWRNVLLVATLQRVKVLVVTPLLSIRRSNPVFAQLPPEELSLVVSSHFSALFDLLSSATPSNEEEASVTALGGGGSRWSFDFVVVCGREYHSWVEPALTAAFTPTFVSGGAATSASGNGGRGNRLVCPVVTSDFDPLALASFLSSSCASLVGGRVGLVVPTNTATLLSRTVPSCPPTESWFERYPLLSDIGACTSLSLVAGFQDLLDLDERLTPDAAGLRRYMDETDVADVLRSADSTDFRQSTQTAALLSVEPVNGI